jgi:hypothetical protein
MAVPHSRSQVCSIIVILWNFLTPVLRHLLTTLRHHSPLCAHCESCPYSPQFFNLVPQLLKERFVPCSLIRGFTDTHVFCFCGGLGDSLLLLQ